MRSNDLVGVLAAAVDALAASPVGDLEVGELQGLLAGLVPLQERLAGVRARWVGELEVRGGGSVPAEPVEGGPVGARVLVRHWLRDVGCGDGSAAGREVRQAGLLRELPLVGQAVVDGRVGSAQAVVLTRLVGRIDPGALAEAEPALVAVAAGRDPQSLGVFVAHLLATWCEPQFEADERSQSSRRFLQTRREADGMLSGRFRLTGADSEVLLAGLEPLARRAGLSDERQAGQRRADALVEVFDLALRHAELPDAGGMRPQVSYVVPAGWAAGQRPAGTFAGLVAASLPDGRLPDGRLPGGRLPDGRLPDGRRPDGQSSSASCPAGSGCRGGWDCPSGWDGRSRPCVPVPVEGLCAVGAWSGPQVRSTVEAVLCDARLTRVLLDPAGQVSGLEALGDTVTRAQRRALVARDRGCVVRGCTRPPAFCDAHHLDHLADGGATELGNLVLLCRRHHVLWHQGRLFLKHLHVPWITGTHDPPDTLAA